MNLPKKLSDLLSHEYQIVIANNRNYNMVFTTQLTGDKEIVVDIIDDDSGGRFGRSMISNIGRSFSNFIIANKHYLKKKDTRSGMKFRLSTGNPFRLLVDKDLELLVSTDENLLMRKLIANALYLDERCVAIKAKKEIGTLDTQTSCSYILKLIGD
tara:strand:- start:116288 stop:116755 length:468 start_codon:yes stop_codon:yes gene_type:complete